MDLFVVILLCGGGAGEGGPGQQSSLAQAGLEFTALLPQFPKC